ncbi:hypothetical protein PR048_013611 [Dryococelus australis]|uniref:Uncharacterized protein n=1 Tax=Dryococelus australis TaxID=614101 RepID=A0ABQ9HST5_9NEOP|nr:hypothetical protein PR048_013611 [Dryococelus australis]
MTAHRHIFHMPSNNISTKDTGEVDRSEWTDYLATTISGFNSSHLFHVVTNLVNKIPVALEEDLLAQIVAAAEEFQHTSELPVSKYPMLNEGTASNHATSSKDGIGAGVISRMPPKRNLPSLRRSTPFSPAPRAPLQHLSNGIHTI